MHSKIMYNTHDQVEFRLLSFSFYCHMFLYEAFVAYKYTAKPFFLMITHFLN